ncbi:MAG: lactonase family protein [Lachnospiraceae bacterium]
MADKYVAYTGSYTYHGKSKGIGIFDVDVETGKLTKRSEVEVNNASNLVVSMSKKFLYAVVDEGIAAFKILSNGDLEPLGIKSIRGMRGCHAAVDSRDSFLAVAGYHDGKMTVLRLNEDGTVGSITAEIYDKGIGTVAERNFRPHITNVRFTPDEKYLLMADSGIDQVKVYSVNWENGHLRLIDIIHCEMNSAPKHIRFSPDGKHMYILAELKNYISVYNYVPSDRIPKFEFKQLVSTLPRKSSSISAASSMAIADDGKYVFAMNAGDNSVVCFEREPESGLLYQKFVLPISGEYPKNLALFPDNKHLISVNNESGTLTNFTIDYEKNLIVMNGRPISVPQCNRCVFVKLPEE